MRFTSILALVICLTNTGRFAQAGDPETKLPAEKLPAEIQLVLDAVHATSKPAFTSAVVADAPEAQAAAVALATRPDALRRITAEHLARCADVAERDGDEALAVADWLVRVATEAKKAAAKSEDVLTSFWQANLARGRIGIARKKSVVVKHWTAAADYLLKAEKGKAPSERQDASLILALQLLREAAQGDVASPATLADHGALTCRRILKAAPGRTSLLRKLADSYMWQTEAQAEGSPKAVQAAFVGYFATFAPIARGEGARTPDVREWNRVVSEVRAARLKVRTSYISRLCFGAGRTLRFELPKTDFWSKSGGTSINQHFEGRDLTRRVTFQTYNWDSHYAGEGSARDVKGDNVKGLAGRSFDTKIEAMTEGSSPFKITKRNKPARKRFNKTMPSGIEYVIHHKDAGGRAERIRCFFVKSVKRKMTVQISIYESAELTGHGPEWMAVVDSFDLTKKKR